MQESVGSSFLNNDHNNINETKQHEGLLFLRIKRVAVSEQTETLIQSDLLLP